MAGPERAEPTGNEEIIELAREFGDETTISDMTWNLARALRHGHIAPETFFLGQHDGKEWDQTHRDAKDLARAAYAHGWLDRGHLEREVDDLDLTLSPHGVVRDITYRLPGLATATGTIVLEGEGGAETTDALLDTIGDLPDGDRGASIGTQLAYLGLT